MPLKATKCLTLKVNNNILLSGDKMIVDAIIEIPMGTKNKYEVEKETGKIRLNRVLYSSVSYPAEYGFIENTIAGDKDPLDILVLSSTPTFPGCIVRGRVLGYLGILDRGEHDEKIIAVAHDDPRFDHLNSIDDLPSHTKDEISEFFKNRCIPCDSRVSPPKAV